MQTMASCFSDYVDIYNIHTKEFELPDVETGYDPPGFVSEFQKVHRNRNEKLIFFYSLFDHQFSALKKNGFKLKKKLPKKFSGVGRTL